MSINELVIRNLRHAAGQALLHSWHSSAPQLWGPYWQKAQNVYRQTSNKYVTIGHYGIISTGRRQKEGKKRLYAKLFTGTLRLRAQAAEEFLRAISRTKKNSAPFMPIRIYLRRIPNKPLNELTAQPTLPALPEGKGAANLYFNVFKAFLSWCVERDRSQNNPLLKRKQPNGPGAATGFYQTKKLI